MIVVFFGAIKKLIIGLVISTVLLFGTTSWYVYGFIHAEINVGASIFRIEPGSNIREFSAELAKTGIIRREWPFLAWAIYKKSTRDIKAGEYRFDEAENLADVLEQIVEGRVVTYSVTLIEGWKFVQIMDLLESSEHLIPDLSGLTEAEILNKIESKYTHPEGVFFPDTYYTVRGERQSAVLSRAHKMMNLKLNEIWLSRSPDLPLQNPYEALILASIIEKETAKDGERPHIAGVLVNRLKKNMVLQVDPTVIYGLGEYFTGDLQYHHLKLDGPYNTYTRKGLTPTPIANPGLKSLLAAVNPLATKDMFFVARGDGGHKFSVTLKEHKDAVRQYQKNQ